MLERITAVVFTEDNQQKAVTVCLASIPREGDYLEIKDLTDRKPRGATYVNPHGLWRVTKVQVRAIALPMDDAGNDCPPPPVVRITAQFITSGDDWPDDVPE